MIAVETLLTGGSYTNSAALARAVGVSKATISRWKKDASTMPLGKAKELAKAQGYVLTLKRTEREYEA